ncbi:MAG: HU family DNA-binding protein [Prevotella sp.]|nr:HU family DNA-binding protein [Prevotella sp.]
MAIHYRLVQNNIKSNKAYGKWYAHTVKQGELNLNEIEKQIQQRCSLTPADVRAAIVALTEVVEEGLKNGQTVNLGELGKFALSIKSLCVDKPEDFRVDTHVKEVVCKYTPEGHRSKNGDRRIVRAFTNGCHLEQEPYYDSNTGERKRARRGGTFRKG